MDDLPVKRFTTVFVLTAALLLPGCIAAQVAGALLPAIGRVIRSETHDAAEANALDPMEIAIYSAIAALLGGGGAAYTGAKNGKRHGIRKS